MVDIEQWKFLFCKCGHNKYDHEDEHDACPTGTGRCLTKGCECQRYDQKIRGLPKHGIMIDDYVDWGGQEKISHIIAHAGESPKLT